MHLEPSKNFILIRLNASRIVNANDGEILLTIIDQVQRHIFMQSFIFFFNLDEVRAVLGGKLTRLQIRIAEEP